MTISMYFLGVANVFRHGRDEANIAQIDLFEPIEYLCNEFEYLFPGRLK